MEAEMVKVETGIALAILMISCGIFGCRGPEQGLRNQPEIVSQELVGSWERVDEYDSTVRVYTFTAQGEWTYTRSGDPSPTQREGEWSLDHNEITFSEEYQEGGEYEREEETETSAIVGDRLYLGGVIVRVRGTGEGLDGTWEVVEGEREEFREEGCSGHGEEIGSWTISITGDSYRSIEDYAGTEVECGETYNYNESEETRGVLRVDGDRVYTTDTETGGNAIDVAHQEERFVGRRIAPNVIYIEGDEEEYPSAGGWDRQ